MIRRFTSSPKPAARVSSYIAIRSSGPSARIP